MTRCCISFTLVVFCVLVGNGCRLSAERRLGDDLVEPSLREQLGVSPDSQADTRVGYLSNMAMQHPSISERDDYLDLYDKEGNWINQIVIVFAEGVAPPADRTRPIEIKGSVGHIDMGGPKGTKREYANDVVFVESWRYLSQKQAPRKKTVEPEN